MLIVRETTIGFAVPDECPQAEKFREQNPDWIENDTSSVIWFRTKEVYKTEDKP